jgi:hypothetical protein
LHLVFFNHYNSTNFVVIHCKKIISTLHPQDLITCDLRSCMIWSDWPKLTTYLVLRTCWSISCKISFTNLTSFVNTTN